MKREARLLLAVSCGQGLWVLGVTRGPSRLEHIVAVRGDPAEAARIHGFFKELRSAYPEPLARSLGLEPGDPELLGPCGSSVTSLLRGLCLELQSLAAAETEPGARDAEGDAG